MTIKERVFNTALGEIKVKEFVSFTAKIDFAEQIASNIIDEKGDYHPYRGILAFDLAFLETYTNYPVPTEAESLLVLYDQMCKEGILDKLKGAVPAREMDVLKQLYDDVVKFKQMEVTGVAKIFQLDVFNQPLSKEELNLGMGLLENLKGTVVN